MLEGLDRIDWSSLHHAYGSASDVPGQIRALASTDQTEREHALYDLFGNIWHQGTVYEASAHAVPFLIELVREPAVQGKVGILGLLDCLATGDPGRRSEHAGGTRAAVETGVQVYLHLLNDDDWQTRLAAAKVLATCDGHRDLAATSLLESFERETDPRVHFGLLLCLGDVEQEQTVDLLKAIVGTEPDPQSLLDSAEEPPSPGFLRWAAAVALIKILRKDATISAVRILEETFANPEPVNEFLEEMPWDHGGAVDTTCSVLSLLPAETAVPILAHALSVVPEIDVWTVAWHLMEIAFPDLHRDPEAPSHPPRELSSLNEPQRRALQALVECARTWQPPLAMGPHLGRLGLPEEREQLREYLQGCRS